MADYEVTLLTIAQCFVYRVPPLASGSGYKAKDWDLQSPIWQGRLMVKSNKGVCVVRLLNNDGWEFAVCPVNSPNAVEKVLDSSRYFALRISDGTGKTAVIGLGFAERNAAFDFQAALQDQQKKQNQEKEIAAARTRRAQEPAIDYSLPTGKTISIELKVKPSATTRPSSRPSARSGRRYDDDDDDDGDAFALPPPPAAHGGAPVSAGTGTSLLSLDSPSSQPPLASSGADGLLDIPAAPPAATPWGLGTPLVPGGLTAAPVAPANPYAALSSPLVGATPGPFGGVSASPLSPGLGGPAPSPFGGVSPSPLSPGLGAPSPFAQSPLAPIGGLSPSVQSPPGAFSGLGPFGGLSPAPVGGAPSPFGGLTPAPAGLSSGFAGLSLSPSPAAPANPYAGLGQPGANPFASLGGAPTAQPNNQLLGGFL